MSLAKELESLRNQRREELVRLHYVYLQTKREVRRKASPDRLVRKHLGAALGVGALLGLFIAPRPTPRLVKEKGAGGGGFFSGMIGNVLRQVEGMFSQGKKAADKAQQKSGKLPKMGGLLQTLLTLLVGKIDLTRLIAEVTRQFGAHLRPERHAGNGHSPEMSVADAGTVKPTDYENLQ